MISVIVRSYNEGHSLETLLHILSIQDVENEIIIVDSNSRDNTKEVAKRYNAKIIQCENFTYGRGLNIGIEQSKFDLVCSLSAHCFPTTNDFLTKMQSHFINDDVVGVYARQIPLTESNIIEKRNICITFLREQSYRDSSYFCNAASMIRKSMCLKYKFDESTIALEDLIWAEKIISLGYRIVYEPNAVIHHYHNEPPEMTSIRYGKEYSVLERHYKTDI